MEAILLKQQQAKNVCTYTNTSATAATPGWCCNFKRTLCRAFDLIFQRSTATHYYTHTVERKRNRLVPPPAASSQRGNSNRETIYLLRAVAFPLYLSVTSSLYLC